MCIQTLRKQGAKKKGVYILEHFQLPELHNFKNTHSRRLGSLLHSLPLFSLNKHKVRSSSELFPQKRQPHA